MTSLFGKPGRDFTANEVKSAADAVHTCAVEAQKAKDRGRAKTLGGLETELVRALGPTLAAIEAGKAKLTSALDTFDAEPAGRDGLRAAAALKKIGEGADHKTTYAMLKCINKTTWTHVQAIVATLREMSPASWNERTLPRLEQRMPALCAAAIAEVGKEILAIPVSLEGLAPLDATVATFKIQVGESLLPEDLAELDRLTAERREAIDQAALVQAKAQVDAIPVSSESLAALDAAGGDKLAQALTVPRKAELAEHVAARRDAIDQGLLAHAKAEIDAMPVSLDALSTLEFGGGSKVAQALSAPRKAELAQYAAERRKTMANTIVDGAIRHVSTLPGTFDGLVELASYTAQARTNGGRFVGPEALKRFDEAVVTRFEAIEGDAMSDFEKRLDETPETEAGLERLDALIQGSLAEFAKLEPELSKPYGERARERRKDVAEEVEEAMREAAERPLSGQTFAEPDGFLQLEFRSGSCVYMKNGPDLITESKYETDEDKVIIETQFGKIVFERRGATLVGQGTTLKPVEQ